MRNETSSGTQSFIGIASIANSFSGEYVPFLGKPKKREILWGSVTILVAARVAYWLFLLIG